MTSQFYGQSCSSVHCGVVRAVRTNESLLKKRRQRRELGLPFFLPSVNTTSSLAAYSSFSHIHYCLYKPLYQFFGHVSSRVNSTDGLYRTQPAPR